MRVVQALHWLRDAFADETTRTSVLAHLRTVLADPTHGSAIRDDLHAGLAALPIWMQTLVRELLAEPAASDGSAARALEAT